jgi:formylglycine-generating enzyme
VNYDYQISEYQVTNSQYAEFLNATAAADPLGLYDPRMGSDPGNGGITQSGDPGSFTYAVTPATQDRPVVYVSFYSALRYANWLSNGGGSGDTESGAYTLLGGTPVPSNAQSLVRSSGSDVFLPSENEWYKAAYYGGSSEGYSSYPFGSDAVPTCTAPSSTLNTANCGNAVGQVTNAGAYASVGPFGTSDLGDDVEEWTDTILPDTFATAVRGASWADPVANLAASHLQSRDPTTAASTVGFRIVQSMPEPGAASMLAAGAALTGWLSRRRGAITRRSARPYRLSLSQRMPQQNAQTPELDEPR